MSRVLVSACLLGERVRYDGKDKRATHPLLQRWAEAGLIVPLCPEVAGGLGIPRPPAERRGARIVTREGVDVTAAFEKGAQAALALCRQLGVRVAVLKEGSPSCGAHVIGDGSFSKTKIEGQGLTAEVLRRAGVQVFSEAELEAAEAARTEGKARE